MTTNKPDERKIAIYARKSKITETGKSIENQIESCTVIAKARFNATSEDILVFADEGKSGFYSDRPQYQKMLHAIENKQIKAVFCYKIDRISRQTVDLLSLLNKLSDRDVTFTSISNDGMDTTTSTGKMMITLLGAFAEFEREMIRERIVDNLYELSKEGRWLGGITPLGFASKKDITLDGGRKKTVNRLEPVPQEQEIVKKAFDIFLRTRSLTATAESLNSQGCRSRGNKKFSITTVKGILQNLVYVAADEILLEYFKLNEIPFWAEETDFDGECAIMAYNKTEQKKILSDDSQLLAPKYKQKSTQREITAWIIAIGKHSGVVSGDTWLRVQTAIGENSQKCARPKESSKSLLSGILRCSQCGGKMCVRTESGRYNPDKTVRFRYVCEAKYRKTGDCTSKHNEKGWELDNSVIEEICKMSTPESEYFAKLRDNSNILKAHATELQSSYNLLQKDYEKIDNGIQRMMDELAQSDGLLKNRFKEELNKLLLASEDKKKQLCDLKEKLKEQSTMQSDIEKAKSALLNFPKLMQLVPYEQKQALLHSILECVVVRDDCAHIFVKGSSEHYSFQMERESGEVCHREQDSIINPLC